MPQLTINLNDASLETLKEYADNRGLPVETAARWFIMQSLEIFLVGQQVGIDKAVGMYSRNIDALSKIQAPSRDPNAT